MPQQRRGRSRGLRANRHQPTNPRFLRHLLHSARCPCPRVRIWSTLTTCSIFRTTPFRPICAEMFTSLALHRRLHPATTTECAPLLIPRAMDHRRHWSPVLSINKAREVLLEAHISPASAGRPQAPSHRHLKVPAETAMCTRTRNLTPQVLSLARCSTIVPGGPRARNLCNSLTM